MKQTAQRVIEATAVKLIGLPDREMSVREICMGITEERDDASAAPPFKPGSRIGLPSSSPALRVATYVALLTAFLESKVTGAAIRACAHIESFVAVRRARGHFGLSGPLGGGHRQRKILLYTCLLLNIPLDGLSDRIGNRQDLIRAEPNSAIAGYASQLILDL